jgi:hypothetical protein
MRRTLAGERLSSRAMLRSSRSPYMSRSLAISACDQRPLRELLPRAPAPGGRAFRKPELRGLEPFELEPLELGPFDALAPEPFEPFELGEPAESGRDASGREPVELDSLGLDWPAPDPGSSPPDRALGRESFCPEFTPRSFDDVLGRSRRSASVAPTLDARV